MSTYVHNLCKLTTQATCAILEFTKMGGGRKRDLCVRAQKGVLEKAHFLNAQYIHANDVQQPDDGFACQSFHKDLHDQRQCVAAARMSTKTAILPSEP